MECPILFQGGLVIRWSWVMGVWEVHLGNTTLFPEYILAETDVTMRVCTVIVINMKVKCQWVNLLILCWNKRVRSAVKSMFNCIIETGCNSGMTRRNWQAVFFKKLGHLHQQRHSLTHYVELNQALHWLFYTSMSCIMLLSSLVLPISRSLQNQVGKPELWRNIKRIWCFRLILDVNTNIGLERRISYIILVAGCTEIDYLTTSSQIQLSPWYIQSLVDGQGSYEASTTLAQGVAEVHIYYAELVKETITLTPGYTLLTLLCDVGGALGLIVGASIISILEIFDFIIMGLLK